MELTVQWNTKIPQQYQYKLNKNKPVCSNNCQSVYNCHYFAIEVGVSGLEAKSPHSLFKVIGFSRNQVIEYLRP